MNTGRPEINRHARRRQDAHERKQVLSISLPDGTRVTGRPEEVTQLLKAHLEARDPGGRQHFADRDYHSRTSLPDPLSLY